MWPVLVKFSMPCFGSGLLGTVLGVVDIGEKDHQVLTLLLGWRDQGSLFLRDQCP